MRTLTLTLVASIALVTQAAAQPLKPGEFRIEFPRELTGFRKAGKVITPSTFPTIAQLEERMADDEVGAVLFFKLYDDEHNHYAPRFEPGARGISFLRADVNRRTSKIRRLRFGGSPAVTLLKDHPDSYDYMHEWGPRYAGIKERLAAFASQAETSGQMNLYLSIGGLTRRITSGRAITKHPSFHPTKPLLLFEAAGRVNLITLPEKLDSISSATRYKVSAVGSQPAWSPDGKSFAYCREVGRVADRPVFEVSVKSHPFGRERRMFRGPSSDLVRNPTWSPDGKYVAFYRKGKEQFGWELRVAEVETSKVTTIARDVVVENHFDDVDMVWGPDTSKHHRLYFFTTKDSDDGYYRIHWADVGGKRGVIDYSDEFTTATDLAAPRTKDGLPQLAFVAIERLSQGVYIVVLNHW